MSKAVMKLKMESADLTFQKASSLEQALPLTRHVFSVYFAFSASINLKVVLFFLTVVLFPLQILKMVFLLMEFSETTTTD